MARSLSALPILDVARYLDLTPAQVVPYGSTKRRSRSTPSKPCGLPEDLEITVREWSPGASPA
jgi:hypothetical protein